MAPRPSGPLLDRICVIQCRLSYARMRISQLERLLAERGIEIPDSVTKVPPVTHWCFPGERTA